MKIVKAIPALLAAICIFAGQIGSANAYFTTYASASGGFEVSWKHKEKIEENYENWNKNVKISADPEGTIPVFVRVKAFAGSTYELKYNGGDTWVLGKDGYYYYQNLLKPGETTSTLIIHIDDMKVSETHKVGDNFNVIVVYESIPASEEFDGSHINPNDADWTNPLGTATENYEVNQGGESNEND